jgi:hypothetical protein
VVIDSNSRITHYRTGSRKGWTYTSRVKAAPTPEDPE